MSVKLLKYSIFPISTLIFLFQNQEAKAVIQCLGDLICELNYLDVSIEDSTLSTLVVNKGQTSSFTIPVNYSFSYGINNKSSFSAGGRETYTLLGRGSSTPQNFTMEYKAGDFDYDREGIINITTLPLSKGTYKLTFGASVGLGVGGSSGSIYETKNLEFSVEEVPEPLTVLGSATALGMGIILKRKSLKERVQKSGSPISK